ncbi:MAG: PorP/SprF family type IX secretion system membrane protein [Bacteroidales bacterium]|nr:PorP/SprF family type IX secretion system membrane protein [Bacteroidales bacterium]
MKKLFATIALTITAFISNAQEIYFSQYYADKLSLNPAFASVPGNSEISMILRSQYIGVEGGFKTYSASYLQKIGQCGFGVGAYGTIGGAYRQNQVSAAYSNTIKINRELRCSAGVEASFANKTLRQGELTYYSMIDPLTGNNNGQASTINYHAPLTIAISPGIMLYTQKTILGVAAYSVAQYKITGENGIPKSIVVFANHKIELGKTQNHQNSETTYLIPSVIYRCQDGTNSIQAGAYIDNFKIMGGVAYRLQTGEYATHTLIASIGVTLGKVQIGYGHDFDLSTITKSTYGAHEIAAKYKLNGIKKNKRDQTIMCPAF